MVLRKPDRYGTEQDDDFLDLNAPPPPVYSKRDNSAAILAGFNTELERLKDRSRLTDAFQLCERMKAEGCQPSLATYNCLLSMCAQSAATTEAWAIFEDMIHMGVIPERETFHHLICASRPQEIDTIWTILDTMNQYHLEPDALTYQHLITRFSDADNLELAVQYLAQMNDQGLSPTYATASAIIGCACRLDFPRLAIDLANAYESTAVRRLDGEVWMRCLIACAGGLYPEGVEIAWRRTVRELHMLPDEGCCTDVLYTAGRHGLHTLAMDVLTVLQRLGVSWREYHFAPVVEAFCRSGNIKEAFGVLALMRENDLEPTAETALPIYNHIRTDADKVDEAWDILETMREEGKPASIIALNVIIQASIALGDLQRAVGMYKVFSDLNVLPNIDTYNLLLSGCITVKHRGLGDRLMADLKEHSLKPNALTYERLILLCLTQAVYEDAFYYLEEMKGEGLKPPINIYEAIIRRCVSVGDTRYKLAVDEMTEQGYFVSHRLSGFIDSGGERDEPDRRQGRPSPSQREARFKKRIFAGIEDPRAPSQLMPSEQDI